MPFNTSFIKGDYSDSAAPQELSGLSVRLPGSSRGSGREITLFRVANSEGNYEVAALTEDAEGNSELRWTDSEAGPSTFLELRPGTSPSFPSSMVEYIADAQTNEPGVAVLAQTGPSYGIHDVCLIAFNETDDTPIRNATIPAESGKGFYHVYGGLGVYQGNVYAIDKAEPNFALVRIDSDGNGDFSQVEVQTLDQFAGGIKHFENRFYMHSGTKTTPKLKSYDPAGDSFVDLDVDGSGMFEAVAPVIVCNSHLVYAVARGSAALKRLGLIGSDHTFKNELNFGGGKVYAGIANGYPLTHFSSDPENYFACIDNQLFMPYDAQQGQG